MGKVTKGPVREKSQIKCLDFMCGGLTDEKLASDRLPKLVSLPMTPEGRFGKTEAMKSSVGVVAGASVMDATLLI